MGEVLGHIELHQVVAAFLGQVLVIVSVCIALVVVLTFA
jgi:hypothetical protein